MAFTPIDAEAFENYHLRFSGMAWTLCNECGGACETSTIASLLPGEAAYIAKQLSIPLDEFRSLFVDGVATSRGVVDVVRLQTRCPFLDDTLHCSLVYFRPVTCAMYPIVVIEYNGRPEFQLDADCPISQSSRAYQFDIHGVAALQLLPVSDAWWLAVEEYDSKYYDFNLCNSFRTIPGYKIFSLEELQRTEV